MLQMYPHLLCGTVAFVSKLLSLAFVINYLFLKLFKKNSINKRLNFVTISVLKSPVYYGRDVSRNSIPSLFEECPYSRASVLHDVL